MRIHSQRLGFIPSTWACRGAEAPPELSKEFGICAKNQGKKLLRAAKQAPPSKGEDLGMAPSIQDLLLSREIQEFPALHHPPGLSGIPIPGDFPWMGQQIPSGILWSLNDITPPGTARHLCLPKCPENKEFSLWEHRWIRGTHSQHPPQKKKPSCPLYPKAHTQAKPWNVSVTTSYFTHVQHQIFPKFTRSKVQISHSEPKVIPNLTGRKFPIMRWS